MNEKLITLCRKLETYFISKGVHAITITQSSEDLPKLKLQVWIQHYLDELGIIKASFRMVDKVMLVIEYQYKSYLGETNHVPLYNIVLHDEDQGFTPDNIRAVVFNNLI